jgi:HD superfamily phosphohydrolase
MRYITQTEIPRILDKWGYDPNRVLNEENYPLLEMNSPALCADRVDYGLRDAISFGTLSTKDVGKIVDSLIAFPNATDCSRRIVIKDEGLAVLFADAYMMTDHVAYTDLEASAYYKLKWK